MRKSGMGGFTLIELMITLVILGILVGVAYPSYTRYVSETRRSDATTNLSRIAALQEKFWTECGVYSAIFNGAIFSPNPVLRCTGLGVGPNAGSFTTTDGFYTLTAAVLPGPAPLLAPGGGGFTLTAQPIGLQAADAGRCGSFTINNTGVTTATGTDGNLINGGKCWKKN